ncbi:P-loop containing nucleoside triphosphate hydrolase protein [Dipodascopsis uninucleata]
MSSNDQNVPQSWEQSAQDDYNQLPQQMNDMNVNGGNQQQQIPPQQGYDSRTYYQQQQYYQQQPYYQQQQYEGYNKSGQYGQNYNQQYQQPYYGNSNNNNSNNNGGYQRRQGGFSPQATSFKPNFNARSFVPSQVRPQNTQQSLDSASTSAAVQASAGPKPVITNNGGAKVMKIVSDSKPQSSASKVLKIVSDPKPEAAEADKKPEVDKKPVAKETKETAKETAKDAPKEAAQPTAASNFKKDDASKSSSKKDSGDDDKKNLRNIEVVDDSHKIDDEVVEDLYGKEHLSIIFMGHVDAGKSTMGGNLLFLTGTVDKRTMEKYEKEAKDAGRENWYLSWVLDLTSEERSKGKTVEVGRGFFETEKRRYTILDAPGHKTYVPSMIGGASQADIGILVISARKGEYETGFERGGQTREHAVLAKNQGVNKLVVAVNKMDDPTVNWSKERYDECIGKLGTYLKSLGYKPKEDVIFMPVSAYAGYGLKDRVPKDRCPWYDGPSLLEFLDNVPLANRKVNAPFMMPIGGKFRDLGTVVEGKIESGHIKKGSSLLLMPNKVPVEILTIYNETEQETGAAACGEQVKLRLKGVEEEDVQVGFVLSSVDHPVHTVTAFEAQIAIIELKSILSAGFTCVIHVHTAVEEVTFNALLHKLEKGTNRKSKKPPAFATRGMKIIARLEVVSTSGFCIERFEDYPQLGRFTLRDQGNTIAIGKVTKLLN